MFGAEVLNRPGPEKRKKKSIKGVLGKNDLAEVYNCEKKSKFGVLRRKSRVDPPPAPVPAPAVKCVEFQEAVLEDILNSQESQSGRRISREETRVLSAIRKTVSQANLLKPAESSNNNDIYSSKQSKISLPSVSSRYEPDNALRRISTIERPMLHRERGIRRRSALDRPNLEATPVIPNSENMRPSSSEDYEPENALRRLRKVDSNSVGASGFNQRQRRSGLSLVVPNISNFGALHMETADPSVACQPGDVADRPRLHRASVTQRPLFSLSIPEDNNVITEATTATTPNPNVKRKTSTGRQIPTSAQSSADCSTVSHSPMIKRRLSVPSQPLKHANSLTSSSNHSPSSNHTVPAAAGNSQSLANSLRREDWSPASGSASTSSSSSVEKLRSSISRHGGSHSNASRYWDWYILNASYGWKSFNSDKFFCY